MKHLILSISFLFAILNIGIAQKIEKKNTPKNKNTKLKKEPAIILDKGLLWKVTGKGITKSSYIYGTFHIFCKDDINFKEPFLKALDSASKIYFELKLDDPAMMLGAMDMMNMKEGKKIKDLLSADNYKKLEKFAKDSANITISFFQSFKPIMLSSLFYPKMMPCKTPSGVETEIMKIAKKNKTKIFGLETMEFQASVFDKIPYETQAKELMKMVDSFATQKKQLLEMIAMYKSEDLNKIEGLTEAGMVDEDAKYNDVLLINRNKNWVTQFKKIFGNESIFVAVGAGHLPGKEGVINLLKKQGYTVEAVK